MWLVKSVESPILLYAVPAMLHFSCLMEVQTTKQIGSGCCRPVGGSVFGMLLCRIAVAKVFDAQDPVDLFRLGLFQIPDDLSQLIC